MSGCGLEAYKWLSDRRTGLQSLNLDFRREVISTAFDNAANFILPYVTAHGVEVNAESFRCLSHGQHFLIGHHVIQPSRSSRVIARGKFTEYDKSLETAQYLTNDDKKWVQ